MTTATVTRVEGFAYYTDAELIGERRLVAGWYVEVSSDGRKVASAIYPSYTDPPNLGDQVELPAQPKETRP